MDVHTVAAHHHQSWEGQCICAHAVSHQMGRDLSDHLYLHTCTDAGFALIFVLTSARGTRVDLHLKFLVLTKAADFGTNAGAQAPFYR